MKFLRRFFKILLIVLVLLVISVWLYAKTYEPKYAGELELENLSDEVTVYFDEIGVPHINAQNQEDGYVALGYLHAQDRLWQMELMRRIAAGRLSEIFGEKLIRTDKLFSGLGIEEVSARTIENLDKNTPSYKVAMAYLNGVNQFIKEGKTPLEYTLVGVEKEAYSLKDMYNVFGYMAFSFAQAHKTDPLLTEIKEKLGDVYLNELIGADSSNLTLIKNSKNDKIQARFATAMTDLLAVLPVSPFIGSNSWVVGADKTKNGKVIFANDPHIAFSQPSVWYEAHMKTPDYEMYGFHLALVPFPLLGHNRNYAYGITMFENDDIDFYEEENNPENINEYKTKNGFLTYKSIEKNIKIKDQKDSIYTMKTSVHGPLMNGIIEGLDDAKPIAMQWIYTKLNNEILDVAYQISHAENLSEFKNGVRKLHAPGLNMMYGDAEDNIAWFAAGKLYKYRESVYRKTFLNGANGNDEIVEYLDFEENPQAINPTWNYVYSANNQPDSIAGMLYPGYYLTEERAKRIVQILDAKDDFTKENVAKMITDVTSSAAPENAKLLVGKIDESNFTASEKTAVNFLRNWKGNYHKKEIGPVIFNRLYYEFMKNTFKDEIGIGFNVFLNTHFADKVFSQQISKQNSIWWDDISTKGVVENKKDVLAKSFKQAFSFLQNQLGEDVGSWTWERVLSVEHKHAVGEVPALRKFFNVGPFKTNGGNEVINNHIFDIDSTGYYKVKGGPSTRRVIDFSDVENSLAILPTGQSGVVFSDHYKDQSQKYLNGGFVKMKMKKSEIEQSKNVLVLKVKQ